METLVKHLRVNVLVFFVVVAVTKHRLKATQCVILLAEVLK